MTTQEDEQQPQHPRVVDAVQSSDFLASSLTNTATGEAVTQTEDVTEGRNNLDADASMTTAATGEAVTQTEDVTEGRNNLAEDADANMTTAARTVESNMDSDNGGGDSDVEGVDEGIERLNDTSDTDGMENDEGEAAETEVIATEERQHEQGEMDSVGDVEAASKYRVWITRSSSCEETATPCDGNDDMVTWRTNLSWFIPSLPRACYLASAVVFPSDPLTVIVMGGCHAHISKNVESIVLRRNDCSRRNYWSLNCFPPMKHSAAAFGAALVALPFPSNSFLLLTAGGLRIDMRCSPQVHVLFFSAPTPTNKKTARHHRWISLPPLPQRRYGCSCCVAYHPQEQEEEGESAENRAEKSESAVVYVIGGRTSTTEPTDIAPIHYCHAEDLAQCYSDNENKTNHDDEPSSSSFWKTLATQPRNARSFAAVVAIRPPPWQRRRPRLRPQRRDWLVLIGGQVGRVCTNSVEYYDGDSWHHLPPMCRPRSHCAAVVSRDHSRIFVVGGFGLPLRAARSGPTPLDSIEYLDLRSPNPSWTLLPQRLRTGRRGCVAVLVEGHVVVIGGLGNAPDGKLTMLASVEVLRIEPADGGVPSPPPPLEAPQLDLEDSSAFQRQNHAAKLQEWCDGSARRISAARQSRRRLTRWLQAAEPKWALGGHRDSVLPSRFCFFQQWFSPKRNAKPQWHCPLSGSPLQNPVVASDGYTYERRAMEAYMSRFVPISGTVLSPITLDALDSRLLIPNLALRSLLQQKKQEERFWRMPSQNTWTKFWVVFCVVVQVGIRSWDWYVDFTNKHKKNDI